MDKHSQDRASEYIVHAQGETHGPFEMAFIEAMVSSGVYSPNISVQKVGTTVRIPFSNIASSAGGSVGLTTGPAGSSSSRRGGGSPTKAPASASKGKRQPNKNGSGELIALAVGMVAILGLVLFIVLHGKSKSPKDQTSARMELPVSSSSYQDATPPQMEPETSPPTPRPSLLPDDPKPVDGGSLLYRDENGQTYRVSNADYYRLLGMRSGLDMKSGNLSVLQAELDALSAQLDRQKIYLDRTSQRSIDAYNMSVGRVNRKNEELGRQFDGYNRGG